MAKVLDEFDFGSNGNGKGSYPWETWTDGKIRELHKGEDFTCKSQTIAMMARSYAKRNGFTVRVKAKKDGDTCVLQFGPTKVAEIGLATGTATPGRGKARK